MAPTWKLLAAWSAIACLVAVWQVRRFPTWSKPWHWASNTDILPPVNFKSPNQGQAAEAVAPAEKPLRQKRHRQSGATTAAPAVVFPVDLTTKEGHNAAAGVSAQQCRVGASAMNETLQAISQRVLEETMKIIRRTHDSTEKIARNPPPSECGKRAEFEQVGKPSDLFPGLKVSNKALMKLTRPDWLCEMRRALAALDANGAMQRNNYCRVFDSCGDGDKARISEHSKVYFVCPSQLKHVAKFTRQNASHLFRGGGATKTESSPQLLPGFLGEQGDENVFCRLAKFIIKGMEEQVLPSYKMKPHECIVQEFFINRQRSGAWTNPHTHPDDFFGGVYYMDAPEGTRLCYDNGLGTPRRKTWKKYAPSLVTKFGKDRHSAGFAEVSAGDILLAPVNWLTHWVPPLEQRNVTRTSVVFNMNCIRAPPTEKLGGKLQMPMLGFGTCCRKSSKGEALKESLAIYFQAGGRLVDTAFMYHNHRDIMEAINKSSLLEEELWLTDKILPSQMGLENTTTAIKRSQAELGWTQLDLMLIHVPRSKELNVASWRALVTAQQEGLVRHVGVSNFNKTQIEELKAATGIMPEVNQIEYNPFSPKEVHEFVKWMQGKGIAVTAYGSLGHSSSKVAERGCGEACAALSAKYGKSPSQVLLRWALDKGVAVIPGATTEEHIEANLDIVDFALSPEEQRMLERNGAPEKWRWYHQIPGK